MCICWRKSLTTRSRPSCSVSNNPIRNISIAPIGQLVMCFNGGTRQSCAKKIGISWLSFGISISIPSGPRWLNSRTPTPTAAILPISLATRRRCWILCRGGNSGVRSCIVHHGIVDLRQGRETCVGAQRQAQGVLSSTAVKRSPSPCATHSPAAFFQFLFSPHPCRSVIPQRHIALHTHR